MAVFNEPTQWDHELGNNADVSTLPDDTSATSGVASLQKLFQLINQTPLEAGGVAPEREDINALFKYLGDQIFYTQNGGVPSYNADYDYIAGRVVIYNGNIYKCIQANGASSTVVAPDSVSPLGSDYWLQVATLADLANFADISLSNINNTAKIAIVHNAMPSNVYDDLTLGASGSTYTAPADGYFVLAKDAVGAGQYITIVGENLRIDSCSATNNNYGLRVFIPVRKGEIVNIGYSATGVTKLFRFVYAVGSESEH